MLYICYIENIYLSVRSLTTEALTPEWRRWVSIIWTLSSDLGWVFLMPPLLSGAITETQTLHKLPFNNSRSQKLKQNIRGEM